MADANLKSQRTQKHFLQKEIDYEEIRRNITPFTFIEARRFDFFIYDSLLSELLEDGCTISARHFKSLIQTERDFLIGNDAVAAVFQDRDFLFELFDMVRLAEKAGRLKVNGGRIACAKLLYQSVILVEKYKTKFHWLLGCYYDIIASILFKMDTHEIAVREIVVRFTYRYGCYLAKKEKSVYSTMKYATKILSAAIDNCRNESWAPDTIPEIYLFESLHQAIALKLAEIYLAFAKHLQLFDADQALEIAQIAIVSLAEAGLKRNKKLVCDFYIAKVDIMMQSSKFLLALREIPNIEHLVRKENTEENNKTKCEAYKRKAICHLNLNDAEIAMQEFEKAFIICQKFHFTHLEAQLMLDIGRAQSNTIQGQIKARLAYTAALHNFKKHGDLKNIRVVEYLLAKLKANQIFPYILNILKSREPCDFYHLRHWKNELKTFWNIADFNDNEIDIMLSTGKVYEMIFKCDLLKEQSLEETESESNWEEEKIQSEMEEVEMESSSTSSMNFINKVSTLISINSMRNRTQNRIYCILKEYSGEKDDLPLLGKMSSDDDN